MPEEEGEAGKLEVASAEVAAGEFAAGEFAAGFLDDLFEGAAALHQLALEGARADA